MCLPQLHRDGSLVKVHSKESERQQGQLSVLTSVLGESGTVASCEHREPQSVSGGDERGGLTCSDTSSISDTSTLMCR